MSSTAEAISLVLAKSWTANASLRNSRHQPSWRLSQQAPVGDGHLMDPWVLGEPDLDRGAGVAGEVVHYQVEVAARIGGGHRL